MGSVGPATKCGSTPRQAVIAESAYPSLGVLEFAPGSKRARCDTAMAVGDGALKRLS